MTRKTFFAPDRRMVLKGGAAGIFAAGLGIPASLRAQEDVELVAISDDLVKAAQGEGTLTVRYSSPVDEMRMMADAFTKRFGISVQLDRKVGALGNQQFATEERAGQHIMDVNYSADPPGLQSLVEEGYYIKYSFPDLDAKLDPGTYIPNIGYCPKWTEVIISYNPDHIPHKQAKEQFKTWDGLLDPALKGRIGLNEPAGGGVPFALYLMLLREPKYGREFLEKLAAQEPRLYAGSAPGREDLAAGAISVFVPNWESIAMIQFMKGDKTAWTYPEMSPGFANTFFAISANAPNPNAARLFVAWFFTEEGARVMHGAQARPTLKGVPDEREAIAKLRETDWWQPYPEEIRWVPDQTDWDSNYKELIPELRKILGWRG